MPWGGNCDVGMRVVGLNTVGISRRVTWNCSLKRECIVLVVQIGGCIIVQVVEVGGCIIVLVVEVASCIWCIFCICLEGVRRINAAAWKTGDAKTECR